MSKIVLIDGHSMLNRAFYGVPDLTNAKGLHTNAIYGFLNILFKILEEEKPDYLTVAFDVHAPTFRHEMYKEYKGTRKPMPEELRQQVPVMKQVLEAMGVLIVEKAGLEADDMSFVSYHNETVMAKAAFPYQKLCRDAALRSGHPLDSLIYIDEAKDKYLVPCHEIFDDTSRPVKAIIILGKASVSQVWLHKLEGLDAFHACVNNLFLRHLLKEKKYAPATAGQCLKIASKVPVYVILRPLEADTTGEVIETAFAITSKVR